MRRSIVTMVILLSLLTVLGTVSVPSPTNVADGSTGKVRITSLRAPGDEATDYTMRNMNFSAQNISYPYWPSYWKYQEPGGDPNGIMTGGYDANYYGQAYVRLNKYDTSSRSCYAEWYQDFSYDTTANENVTSFLCFHWRVGTYSNGGSNNTLSVLLRVPSGTTYRVWYTSFSGTSNWDFRSFNVTDMTAGMKGTFRVILRYYGATRPSSNTNIYVYWDDVGMVFKYKLQYPPTIEYLSLNSNATYTGSRNVSARLQGTGITSYFLSNNGSELPSAWQNYSYPVVNWTLTPGDGNKTVYFWAHNTKGNSTPSRASDSIWFDGTPPHAPTMIDPTPSNGSGVGDSKPTLKWTCSDIGGSGVHYYVVEIDSSPSFDNSSGKIIAIYNWTLDYYVPPYGLSNGRWYWRVHAVDNAGNVGAPVSGSFSIQVTDIMMVIIMAGGGTGGVAFLLIIAFYFVRKARIPMVIKKIDQSIKLIGKGEMPRPVPMRTRTQLTNSLYQSKLLILSKEKLEEVEVAKKKRGETTVALLEQEALGGESGAAGEAAGAKPREADVDMIVKELEKLETKSDKQLSEETDLIKQEIEKLEKSEKRKKSD